MAEFVAASACNGCRPKHLRGRIQYQRSGLLSRMIKRRDVARFLIAPSGFGKTALALTYAEAIFGFRDVFWMSAKSPCFLRDVDRGSLVPTILSLSRPSSLVVFEDIEPLDASRVAVVSSCIDALLEHGLEVIVTMTPYARSLAERQLDCVCIEATDLLVSADELNDLSQDARYTVPGNIPARSAEGMPAMVWDTQNAVGDMLAAIVKDNPPTDTLARIFIMTVLIEGSLADVDTFAGEPRSDTLEEMENYYPFVGMCARDESFQACEFDIACITRAFGNRLERIAAHSPFSDVDTFIARLADVLLARGKGERACILVRESCNAAARFSWLASRGVALGAAGCLLPAHRLFECRSLRLTSHTASLFAGEAQRLAGLGMESQRNRITEQVLCKTSTPDDVRLRVALLAACGSSASLRDEAVDMLSGLAGGRFSLATSEAAAVLENAFESDDCDEALGAAIVSIANDDAKLHTLLDVLNAATAVGEAYTALYIFLLEAASLWWNREQTIGILDSVDSYFRRLDDTDASVGPGEVRLLTLRDRLRANYPLKGRMHSVPALRARIGAMDRKLFAQRSELEQEQRRQAMDTTASEAHASRSIRKVSEAGFGASAATVSTVEAVPTLHVRLFGGLDVSIGNVDIPAHMFSRQKVKTLLAILVLNRGRELVREHLAAQLWPNSSHKTAQRNYNTIWTTLRRALMLPGTDESPYLVRLQYSCKLDARFVSCDVYEFEEMCGRLMLEAPDSESWAAVDARVKELYRGELLPGENDDEFIKMYREECRMKYIDALVSAAQRLLDNKEMRSALWFAQAVVREEPTREDAYTLLMRAQIALGQRTAALETYFRCKRYLSEELGIDPSSETVSLYTSVIESDPGFAAYPRLG